MKILLGIAIILFSLAFTNKSLAQQTDTTQTAKINYYQQHLVVDKDKAAQIVQIYDDYKASVKQIAGDNDLSDDRKRKKIDRLIIKKNIALKAILNPEQQKKLIPDSEH